MHQRKGDRFKGNCEFSILRLRDVQIENRDLSHLCLLQMDPLDNPPPVPGIQPYMEKHNLNEHECQISNH